LTKGMGISWVAAQSMTSFVLSLTKEYKRSRGEPNFRPADHGKLSILVAHRPRPATAAVGVKDAANASEAFSKRTAPAAGLKPAFADSLRIPTEPDTDSDLKSDGCSNPKPNRFPT
jgi:hypothetical protein